MLGLKTLISLLILILTIALAIFIGFYSYPHSFYWDLFQAQALNAFPLGPSTCVVQLLRGPAIQWELKMVGLRKEIVRWLDQHGLAFKKRRQIYRLLGVDAFVRFLRLIGWESMMRKAAPVRHDRMALMRYRDEIAISESVHLLSAFVVMLGCLAWGRYVDSFSWSKLIWVLVFCYLFHLLPILTQWRNRERLDALLRRQNDQRGQPSLIQSTARIQDA